MCLHTVICSDLWVYGGSHRDYDLPLVQFPSSGQGNTLCFSVLTWFTRCSGVLSWDNNDNGEDADAFHQNPLEQLAAVVAASHTTPLTLQETS